MKVLRHVNVRENAMAPVKLTSHAGTYAAKSGKGVKGVNDPVRATYVYYYTCAVNPCIRCTMRRRDPKCTIATTD